MSSRLRSSAKPKRGEDSTGAMGSASATDSSSESSRDDDDARVCSESGVRLEREFVVVREASAGPTTRRAAAKKGRAAETAHIFEARALVMNARLRRGAGGIKRECAPPPAVSAHTRRQRRRRGAPESAPRRSAQTTHGCRHGPERPLHHGARCEGYQVLIEAVVPSQTTDKVIGMFRQQECRTLTGGRLSYPHQSVSCSDSAR